MGLVLSPLVVNFVPSDLLPLQAATGIGVGQVTPVEPGCTVPGSGTARTQVPQSLCPVLLVPAALVLTADLTPLLSFSILALLWRLFCQ